ALGLAPLRDGLAAAQNHAVRATARLYGAEDVADGRGLVGDADVTSVVGQEIPPPPRLVIPVVFDGGGKDVAHLGFTHVSDQARPALDDGRSPRFPARGWPFAVLPFISTCAERAGKNVLNTPIGRFMKPGGIVRTKGSMKSRHVRRIRSLPATTSSLAVERASPARVNFAAVIGSFSSANAG